MSSSTTSRLASVKWFSNRKGFGFLTDLESKEDVFVHHTGIKTPENVYRTLVGAARDTAQSTMELGYDVYEYATGEEFTDEQKEWLPEIPEPQYFGGSVVRDITGFVIPYAGLSKVLSAAELVEEVKWIFIIVLIFFIL